MADKTDKKLINAIGDGANEEISIKYKDMNDDTYAERKYTISSFDDNVTVDAFGRLRVSNSETLFDSKQIFDNGPLFWDDQQVSGSGTSSTHSTDLAASMIGVGAVAGKRVRQTFMRFNYQPGKSQRIFLTCANLMTGVGITKGFGIGDDNNGLFLVCEEGTLKFVRRSHVTGSAVDSETELNTTLPDGTEIDLSKTMILDIDFEWLGVGRVRAGYVRGVTVDYLWTFTGVNNLSTVYMSTPNLPLRYWIENDGNGSADTFIHICASVMSEGGLQNNGILFSDNLGSDLVQANTIGTFYALLGIRLKVDHLGATVKIVNETVMASTVADFLWELRFNPTVAGTFNYSDYASYSAVQIAKGDVSGNPSTNTVTGGQKLRSSYGSGNTSQTAEIFTARHLGAAIDGTRDTLILCVAPMAANLDIRGAFTWRELV